MLRHRFEIARKITQTWTGPRLDVHEVEYRLAPRPYRLLHRHELPKNHQFEDWETDEDVYFRKDGVIYNLREFCTNGCRMIPGPNGGAQTASNGEFLITEYHGKVYNVMVSQSIPYGMYT
jgi:hypothetical protein